MARTLLAAALLLGFAALMTVEGLPILPISQANEAADAHDDGFPSASLDDLYKELSHNEKDSLPFEGEDDHLDMPAPATPRFEEVHLPDPTPAVTPAVTAAATAAATPAATVTATSPVATAAATPAATHAAASSPANASACVKWITPTVASGAPVQREGPFLFTDASGSAVYGIGGCEKDEPRGNCATFVASWDPVTLTTGPRGGNVVVSAADADRVALSNAAYAARPSGEVFDFGGQRPGGISNVLGHLFRKPETQMWTWESISTTGETVSAREMSSLTAVGDILVLFGGNTVAGATDDLFYLSTTGANAGKWQRPNVTGTKPRAVFAHSATYCHNNLYVFGGTSGDATFNTLFVLTIPNDPTATWTWSSPAVAGAFVPTARARHGAFCLKDSLYILPGIDAVTSKLVAGVHVLDIINNAWVVTPAAVQDLLPVSGRGAVVVNGVAIISGGKRATAGPPFVDYGRPSFLDFSAVCPESCVNGYYNETGFPHCDCKPNFQGKFCESATNCAVPCKNGGACVKGACSCPTGFGGVDCTQSVCPDNCTDATHGTCSKTEARCICKPGFWGLNCSESSCPSNCMGRGICQPAGKNGHVENWCLCLPGFSGPGCENYAAASINGTVPPVSPNAADLAGVKKGAMYSPSVSCPNHCGGHGVCTAVVSLTGSIQGVCACAAGFAGVDCSGECTQHCSSPSGDLNGVCEGPDAYSVQCKCKLGYSGPGCNDRYCARNCTDATHGKCEGNQCLCFSPYYGGACEIDTHCSNHGKFVDEVCQCDPGFGGANCEQHVECTPGCDNGGSCVGSPVTENQPRSHGVCQCPPGWSGPTCAERTCPNACSLRGTCNDGLCKCYSGYAGDDCSTTLLCPQNCTGAHGTCKRDTNRGGNFGVCECAPEWTGADCSVIGCPNACYHRGKCMEGKCDCDPGYSGQSCETACPSKCSSRGLCLQDGACKCYPGFFGPDCSETGKCPGGATPCSGHGVCFEAKESCFCEPGFTGPDCSKEHKCGEQGCGAHGECANSRCYCHPGWEGEHCERQMKCPHDCYNRGICSLGKCSCFPSFEGEHCERQTMDPTCPGNCTGKGVCMNGVCYCLDGQTGPDCNTVVDIAKCKQTSNSQICENRGICMAGRCFCDPGFAGAFCHEAESCPLKCVEGQGLCIQGKCRCLPGFSGADCSQDLVCEGSPLPCSGNGVCIQGQCACNGGYGGSDCSKLLYGNNATCPNDCSNFGVCHMGRCFCVEGRTGADCSVQTQNACPLACSGNGVCRFGSCFCKPGFAGKSCEVAVKCTSKCLENGVCAYGKCFCVAGWTGRDCDVREEDAAAVQKIIDRDIKNAVRQSMQLAVDKSTTYCKGGCGPGVCVQNMCHCPTGFYGANCRQVRQGPRASRCANNCSNNGQCVLGHCYCFAGWGGLTCDKVEPLSCPSNCHGRGRCQRGMCFCDAGWEGLDCGTTSKCVEGCVEGRHGVCMNGKCQCVDGFSGPACNETLLLGVGAGAPSTPRFQERVDASVPFEHVIDLGKCDTDCGANGLCVNQQCYCKPGFSGADCTASDAEPADPVIPAVAKLAADVSRDGESGGVSYVMLGGLCFAAGIVVVVAVQLVYDRHKKLQQQRETTKVFQPLRQGLF